MKISLLIDPKISAEIIKIKNDLYVKGVRTDNKTDVGIPHIKIAETQAMSSELEVKTKLEINSIFEKYKENTVKNFELVNKPRENLNWIALQISEAWLHDLSHEIEDCLESMKINRTKEYKQKIYDLRKIDNPGANIDIEYCIADHLNLISKCRSNFADEAYSKFSFLRDYKEIKISDLLFEED